jgi:DivIVA domain-containing protein
VPVCPLRHRVHGPVWHDRGVGTVLAVLGVLAVLFVAALVATRDGEILVDAPRDRAEPELPADGPVGADDLERVRFGMALRGYRMDEVDALLDRLAAELRERDARLAAAEPAALRTPPEAPGVGDRPVPHSPG